MFRNNLKVSCVYVNWLHEARYLEFVDEDYESESWEKIYESEELYESCCRRNGLFLNVNYGFTTWRKTCTAGILSGAC
jgi:hypothetical protein